MRRFYKYLNGSTGVQIICHQYGKERQRQWKGETRKTARAHGKNTGVLTVGNGAARIHDDMVEISTTLDATLKHLGVKAVSLDGS